MSKHNVFAVVLLAMLSTSCASSRMGPDLVKFEYYYTGGGGGSGMRGVVTKDSFSIQKYSYMTNYNIKGPMPVEAWQQVLLIYKNRKYVDNNIRGNYSVIFTNCKSVEAGKLHIKKSYQMLFDLVDKLHASTIMASPASKMSQSEIDKPTQVIEKRDVSHKKDDFKIWPRRKRDPDYKAIQPIEDER